MQRQLHSIPFYIPVVAGIYGKISTARVLYSMSTMLDAGLTMTSTIKRSAAAAGNEYVAHKLNQANERIMEGASLGEALSTAANGRVCEWAVLALVVKARHAQDRAAVDVGSEVLEHAGLQAKV